MTKYYHVAVGACLLVVFVCSVHFVQGLEMLECYNGFFHVTEEKDSSLACRGLDSSAPVNWTLRVFNQQTESLLGQCQPVVPPATSSACTDGGQLFRDIYKASRPTPTTTALLIETDVAKASKTMPLVINVVIKCAQGNQSAACRLRRVVMQFLQCYSGELTVRNDVTRLQCHDTFARNPVYWEVVYPDHGQNKTVPLAQCPAMTDATVRPCVQNNLPGPFTVIRKSATQTALIINASAMSDAVNYIRGLTIRCRHDSIFRDCLLDHVSPIDASLTLDVVINMTNNVFTCEGLCLVDTVRWEVVEHGRVVKQDAGVCPPPYGGNCTQPLAPLFRTHRSWESATISTLTLDGSDPRERARLENVTIVCRTPQSSVSKRAFVGVDLAALITTSTMSQGQPENTTGPSENSTTGPSENSTTAHQEEFDRVGATSGAYSSLFKFIGIAGAVLTFFPCIMCAAVCRKKSKPKGEKYKTPVNLPGAPQDDISVSSASADSAMPGSTPAPADSVQSEESTLIEDSKVSEVEEASELSDVSHG